MTRSEWFIESPVWHKVETVGGQFLASAPKLATALELALDFSKYQGCPIYIRAADGRGIQVDYWNALRDFEVKAAA